MCFYLQRMTLFLVHYFVCSCMCYLCPTGARGDPAMYMGNGVCICSLGLCCGMWVRKEIFLFIHFCHILYIQLICISFTYYGVNLYFSKKRTND